MAEERHAHKLSSPIGAIGISGATDGPYRDVTDFSRSRTRELTSDAIRGVLRAPRYANARRDSALVISLRLSPFAPVRSFVHAAVSRLTRPRDGRSFLVIIKERKKEGRKKGKVAARNAAIGRGNRSSGVRTNYCGGKITGRAARAVKGGRARGKNDEFEKKGATTSSERPRPL